MREETSRLNNALQNYKEVQFRQLALFDNAEGPDLDAMKFYRASAYADLKNNLDSFLNISHIDMDPDLIHSYQKELKEILNTDQTLKEKITLYKEDLEKQMLSTCKAKTAIGHYAQASSAIRRFR